MNRKKTIFVFVFVMFSATVAIVVVSGTKVQNSARSNACLGNLCAINSAMHRYHEKYGHFPKAITTINGLNHSWRVLLLEFLDPVLLQKYDFTEEWNGPNNKHLANKTPRFYCCPSDEESCVIGRSNYFVVMGEGTVFPSSKSTAIRDIGKPLNQVALIIESVGMGILWTEPKDLSHENFAFGANDEKSQSVLSKHVDGPLICMVDASTLHGKDVSNSELLELFQRTTQLEK